MGRDKYHNRIRLNQADFEDRNSKTTAAMPQKAQVKTMKTVDFEGMQNLLNVWRSKRGGDFEEAVRLLDQSEVLGKPFGEELTLQVLDYTDCDWVPGIAPGGRAMSGLSDWYSFIRHDLGWTGPIRLAVAAI